jgi:hypothetical protein
VVNGGGLGASAISNTSASIVVSSLTAGGNNAHGMGGAMYGASRVELSVLVSGTG